MLLTFILTRERVELLRAVPGRPLLVVVRVPEIALLRPVALALFDGVVAVVRRRLRLALLVFALPPWGVLGPQALIFFVLVALLFDLIRRLLLPCGIAHLQR